VVVVDERRELWKDELIDGVYSNVTKSTLDQAGFVVAQCSLLVPLRVYASCGDHRSGGSELMIRAMGDVKWLSTSSFGQHRKYERLQPPIEAIVSRTESHVRQRYPSYQTMM